MTMPTLLDSLTALGANSLDVLWLPLAAWTVLWLLAELGLRLASGAHPVIRYRVAQAVLFSLPLGIAAGAVLDLPSLLPAGAVAAMLPEIVVTPLAEEAPAGLAGAAGTAVASAPALTVWALLGLLVAAAAAAALARLAILATHAAALARLRRRLAPAAVDGLGDEVRLAAGRLGVRQRVEVIAAADAEVPMTFGLARPLIVLPAWLAGEERRLALLHELAHVRQRDYAAQWLEALVAAVFVLHPGVHRLRRRCELLRELTCDAALLGEAAVSRRAYASLVYSFVSPPARATPVSVGMADRPSHIHLRFEAMKSFRSTRRPTRLAMAAALGVLLSGSLLLGASGVLAQDPPDRNATALLLDGITPERPIIFVDGVRIEGDLQALDPNDIAHVEVLRGETAVAAYGEEAAGGVVRITTKGAPLAPAPPPPPMPPPPTPAADDPPDVFVVVEDMPSPIGGLEALQARVAYPELARRAGIEGTVFVQFIVNEQGDTEDISVVRGIGAGADEAAVRAVQETRFTPGRQRGQEVKVRMSLPVRFRLPAEGSTQIQMRSFGISDRPDGNGTELRVDGTVWHDGRPVPDAQVRLQGVDDPSFRTREGSGFSFVFNPTPLEPGSRIRVTARHPSFGTYQQILTVPGSTATGVSNAVSEVSPPAGRPAGDAAPAEFGTHGVFPNPTQNAVGIAFSLPEAAEVRVELFDMAGRRVLASEQSFPAGARHHFQVPTDGLAAGTYAYRLHASGEMATGTLTIAR
jgi:TonB family protein